MLVPVRNGMPHLPAQLEALAGRPTQAAGRSSSVTTAPPTTASAPSAPPGPAFRCASSTRGKRQDGPGRSPWRPAPARRASPVLRRGRHRRGRLGGADNGGARPLARGRRVPRRGIARPAGVARLAPAGHSRRAALPVRAAACAYRGELRGVAGCLRGGRRLRSLLPVARRKRPTCSGGFSWLVTSSAMRRRRSWPPAPARPALIPEAVAWLRPGPRTPAGPSTRRWGCCPRSRGRTWSGPHCGWRRTR